MTVEEYHKLISPGTKTNKYKNVKTTVDDITFDSKAEAARYSELLLLKRAGEIQGFARQPSFVLDAANTRYRPDFIVCGKDGTLWVEDVKGMETSEFKRKKRQWEQAYPWLELKIIKQT